MIHPGVLLLLGFALGVLTGFFGVGGGWLLTPALNILGLPMVYAIGTGFFTLVGKTLYAATQHHKLGNVDIKLGAIMGICSIAGVDLGKRVVFYLEKANLAGTYVRAMYIVLMFAVSLSMLLEYFRYRKMHRKEQGEGKATGKEQTPGLARYIYPIGLPPKISLSRSAVYSISLWVIISCGLLIGFVSGFIGIGGGFIALPLLIYVIGAPTINAVGTSLVVVLITSCYGTYVFALVGYVQWLPALILLAGSLIGVHLGVYATRYVTGLKIRNLFALMVLSVGVSVLLKQINMALISSYLVMSSACALCLVILFPLRKNLFHRPIS
jgi:uncharacterized membrane protein YfcA